MSIGFKKIKLKVYNNKNITAGNVQVLYSNIVGAAKIKTQNRIKPPWIHTWVEPKMSLFMDHLIPLLCVRDIIINHLTPLQINISKEYVHVQCTRICHVKSNRSVIYISFKIRDVYWYKKNNKNIWNFNNFIYMEINKEKSWQYVDIVRHVLYSRSMEGCI